MLSYTSSLIGDAKKHLESCYAWTCSFVRREGNSVAHKLAKFAHNIGDLVSWQEKAPEFLSPLVTPPP